MIQNKWIAVLCTLSLLCVMLCACASSEVILRDGDGEVTIVLPSTKQEIIVEEEFARYLPLITDKSVEKAEQEILDQLDPDSESPEFYLVVDQEGYLCLKTEMIRELEPPPGTEILGCGIDHEHVFFESRISSMPLQSE